MGLYDSFGSIQIKAAIWPSLKEYKIGDKVDGGLYEKIEDGVYIASNGIVVIYNGVFVAELTSIFDKWGNKLEINEANFDMINTLYGGK